MISVSGCVRVCTYAYTYDIYTYLDLDLRARVYVCVSTEIQFVLQKGQVPFAGVASRPGWLYVRVYA
jgi:hypothetical protein